MPDCWLNILAIAWGTGTLENKFGLLLKRHAFCRGDVKTAEQDGLHFALEVILDEGEREARVRA